MEEQDSKKNKRDRDNLRDIHKDINEDQFKEIVTDLKKVIKDLYQWRTSDWSIKTKIEAFRMLARLVDYYHHIYSERFSYLFSFCITSPFHNINANLDELRSIYTKLNWENENNPEPPIKNEDGNPQDATIDFFKLWYKDDKFSGNYRYDEQCVKRQKYKGWGEQPIDSDSEQEAVVKRLFMNMDEDGCLKNDDKHLLNMYSILDTINDTPVSRIVNDLKRATGSIIRAFSVLKNDINNCHFIERDITDRWRKSSGMDQYVKQACYSWNLHKRFSQKMAIQMLDNRFKNKVKTVTPSPEMRRSALEQLKEESEQKLRDDKLLYRLYLDCYDGKKFNETKFAAVMYHKDSNEFINHFFQLQLIDKAMSEFNKERSQNKQIPEPSKEDKGACKKSGKPNNDSKKQILSVTFTKRDITDAHLTLVYQRLVKENWISPGDNANDFLNLFSGRLCKCKVIWTNAVSKGNLAHLIHTMWLENHISIPEGYGYQTIIESHFVDRDGNYLTNVKGGSKSKKAEAIIKDCMKLLSLDAGTDA